MPRKDNTQPIHGGMSALHACILARSHHEAGDIALALQEYALCCKFLPHKATPESTYLVLSDVVLATALSGIAVCCASVNEKKAVKLCDEALALWPTCMEALVHLASMRWNQGFTKQATSLWQAAVLTPANPPVLDDICDDECLAIEIEKQEFLPGIFKEAKEKQSFAKYRLCVALHQLGLQNQPQCLRLLRDFGCTKTLSPKLWSSQLPLSQTQTALAEKPDLPLRLPLAKRLKSGPKDEPLLYKGAIPTPLHTTLCDAFDSDSVFW